MTNIGPRLKKLRLQNNMKLIDIAKALNVHDYTIRRYESGERTPDTDMFIWYCKNFGVSMDWIYGLTDDPTPYHKKEPPQEGRLKAYTLSEDGKPVRVPITDEEERLMQERIADARMRQIALEVVQDELSRRNSG